MDINNGLLIQYLFIIVPGVDRGWSNNHVVSLPTAFSSKYIVVLGDTTPWGPEGNGICPHSLITTQFQYNAYNTGGNSSGVIAIGC